MNSSWLSLEQDLMLENIFSNTSCRRMEQTGGFSATLLAIFSVSNLINEIRPSPQI